MSVAGIFRADGSASEWIGNAIRLKGPIDSEKWLFRGSVRCDRKAARPAGLWFRAKLKKR
jgi:hypothetical protein